MFINVRILIFHFIAIIGVDGLDNGLALKPPMGWLSWARFLCQTDCVKHPLTCINEQLYVDMADRLVQDGYRDAGYEYVNVDDCWLEMERDDQNNLVANRTRFPHGIKWLADYMHKNGLKLGMYEDFGNLTCAGYPGSLYHLEQDANLFASWNVDMLKLDGCYASPKIMPSGYPKMGQFLNATGRPIVYSCSWPAYEVEEQIMPNYPAIANACNLWRNFDDISLNWNSISKIINWYDNHQDEMIPVQGPGRWNDPDMIIVGNEQLTEDQSKAQMAIWSIWSAPLIMSNDLRFILPKYKNILLNKKVIAVDQDPLGIMGRLIYNTTFVGIYLKPMSPYRQETDQYSYAIVFLNRHRLETSNVTIDHLSNIGLNNENGYSIEELFTNTNYGSLKPTDSLYSQVNPTGVAMFKATVL